MQQGEFFEFDKTTETTQTEAGKALYEKLVNGYRFLDPQEERNGYTKEQIFKDKVLDYMDFYEVGFLDDETKAEMTEQEIVANHNQAYRETQEFLARDILGRAIREDNDEIVKLAANHISDIKDVKFETSENGLRFNNIVEFATYSEAQAGRVDLGGRDFEFHASTGPDAMSAVMRIAGDAYGREEAQKMRVEAFKEYGFVPVRVDHRSSLESDLTAQMDVSVEGMGGDHRLEFENVRPDPLNANGYRVRQEGEKFDKFLSDVVSHYELGAVFDFDGISRDDLVDRLNDVGVFVDAEDHMRTFMNETTQLNKLAELVEMAAQTQANQLSSMISEGGQSDTKAFLNRGEQAGNSERDRAFESAIKRYVKGGGNEEDGRKLLDEQIKHFDPKNLPAALVHLNFATASNADRIAAALSGNQQANDATPDLVKQAGNTAQLDADLKAFEADALKRGVSQENIDGFKSMVREGAGIVQGVHQASQQSNEPSERMKAIEASLVSKGIPQEALDDFKNKVLGNQEGQQAAQNKPVFTKEDSAAFVDAVQNTAGSDESEYAKAYRESLQAQKDKNLGFAKDLGGSAVPFAVDAMKDALKDMSPTGHTKDSANTFYKARKSANEALESMVGRVPNERGLSVREADQKIGDLLTRAEDTLGGKFSKSDDGRLKFEFNYPVDARLVTSVANKAKGLAEDVVKEAKAERATQQPAAHQPATQAPKEAPIETSSTGRITGGGRFSRPPSPEAVAQARQEPPVRARSSGRSL